MTSSHDHAPPASDPVAIIGTGCRFPGARGPAAFWKLLCDGVDAISEIPPDRFDIAEYHSPRAGVPGKLYVRHGGFLDGIDQFDPYFFEISPREAAAMDPQHRLLLEVVWEALEDAGQVPARLAGSSVGVFVGNCTTDYENLIKDPAGFDIYVGAGNARSVLSGRISFALAVQGPSLTLDTACSTSLVAVHLACHSLMTGESTLAIAGGTNLVLSPVPSLAFCSAQMLAPDGRCKAFDARGDGFVRSDGVGVVILKPLSRALADRDSIYAVIRGSAVNNDGKSGGLLMTPSRPGQEAVIRDACRRAGVSPGHLQYVETHGTGTSAGDPIEAMALGTVLAEGRSPDQPCAIGSVKTNIGHTEGAAGVAGLIKVALALKHRMIPPSLHFQTPNPEIPWGSLPLVVQTALGPWPARSGPARAGVSSFGISGTNAHAVVEEAPPTARSAPLDGPPRAELVPLSAHTPDALRSMAQAWERFLLSEAAGPVSLEDLAYTASVRRAPHDYRLAVVARSPAELAEHLRAYGEHEARTGLSAGRALAHRQRIVVFVFPGQGSQWVGMAQGLMAQEPVFRTTLERCDAVMRRFTDWSLLQVLDADEAQARLDQLDVVQPALFAVQVALAALWRSWGIEPAVVVGHSMGEVAAAHVAGAIGLDDASRIICHRSQIVRRRASGKGGMAVVELPGPTVRALLAGYSERLTVAAYNGPTTTVVSGDPAALEELRGAVEGQGTFFQLVKVDYASHSAQMEPLRDELGQALSGIVPGRPSVPMLSTVTARVLADAECDGDYWIRNIRDPVLFSNAIDALAGDGHDTFLEVSPHPILTGAIAECLRLAGRDGVALPSLRRGEDGRASMLGSLGSLYTLGYPVDWSRLHGSRGSVVPLPSYPWQRERFWLDKKVLEGDHGGRGGRRGQRLLGEQLTSAVQVGAHFWERDLSLGSFPYLGDHRVQEHPVLPAAAYLEMALAAAVEAFGPGPHVLEKVVFEKALFVSPEPKTVQLAVSAQMGGATFQFLSREASATGSDATWTRHVTGAIRFAATRAPAPGSALEEVAAIQARCAETVAGPDFYRAVQARGVQYGPSFQGLERLWQCQGEALGRVRASAEVESAGGTYRIHPALLDACFQVVAAALSSSGNGRGQLYLPVGVERMCLHARPGAALWSHAVVRATGSPGAGTLEANVIVLDDAGQVVLEVVGLGLQRLEPEVSAATETTPDWLYEVTWSPKPLAVPSAVLDPLPPDQRGRWLIFADAQGVAAALRDLLEARGERCVLLSRVDDAREFLTETFGAHQPAWRSIVHLWSLDAASADETTPATLADANDAGCISVLHLVQALGVAGRGEAPRLWLVTQKAQAVGAPIDSVSIAQAPLWGLGKTIALEHPELRCTRIDLGPAGDPDDVRALFNELWLNDGEDEVALRGGQRHVPRLQHRGLESPVAKPVIMSSDHPFRLEVPTVGILDNFVLRATPRTAPGPGQVEIRVRALGLNFRDVLIALGLVPPVFKGTLDFGWESAGTIVALGDGVDAFQVGDEVLAVAPGCFGSYATTPASAVTPKPPHLSFEEAATIPIVFVTAYYALHHLGRLQPKERILIHAASGGVGLAAVQIAQHVGAEIFATAGSPEKRDFLRSLGVPHVMDSRSLDFAEQVRELTGGQGVDVVLNSLAGDFIAKSVSTLGPGGRFLEIGKVDVLRNTPLGLGLLEKNIAFFVIDLAYIFLNRPDFGRAVLSEVIQHLHNKTLKPLPLRVFPASQAVEAFRHLAQAKHIGKVIVSLQEPEVAIAPAVSGGPPVRPDGTYLVTGGFGGLGLAVAAWLVAQGARHLVLMGRSGPTSPAAKETLETLKASGVHVGVAHGDVAREGDVARVLNGIREHMPPLRGVIHAATVLDDGILLQQDRERFARVMAAKVNGAWALHTLTTDDPLDFFVLFSSGASVMGSPGQGNYVAANAFLDALAHHRRARGRPAVAINWGAWGEVGLAARADRETNLAGRGVMAMHPSEALRLFGRILRDRPVQVTAARVNWALVGRLHAPPLLQELIAGAAASPPDAASDRPPSPRELILAAPAQRRGELLQELVVTELARVLRCAPSRIDVHQPLTRLGLDSLMAVEFRNRIEGGLAVRLPVAELLKGPTIVGLAARLTDELGRTTAPDPGIAPRPERDLLARLDQLSDEEVDALLRARQAG